MIIFAVWGITASLICLYFIDTGFSEKSQEKLAENIGVMLFYSIMFLTAASSFIKKHLNVKRTMILAAIFYSLGICALAISIHEPN